MHYIDAVHYLAYSRWLASLVTVNYCSATRDLLYRYIYVRPIYIREYFYRTLYYTYPQQCIDSKLLWRAIRMVILILTEPATEVYAFNI